MVRSLEGLHAPVEACGEVVLERRSPAVHRGHPWVRVSPWCRCPCSDMLVSWCPSPREPPAPATEPGAIRVEQPVGNQCQVGRCVALLDTPHGSERPRPDVTTPVVGVEVTECPVPVDVRPDPMRRDQSRIAAPVHPPVRPPLRDREQPWELLPDPRTCRVLVTDGVDTEPGDKAVEFIRRPVPANPPEGLGEVGGTSPDDRPDGAGIRSVDDPG